MLMKNKVSLVIKSIAIFTTSATLALALAYYILDTDWLLTCAISFGTTAYHFLMRLAVGYLMPKVTHYDFDYHHPWFLPRNWERAFYQKLQLHRWKGKLPTYAPSQFSLQENDLHRIIQNMCGAELVHEVIMLCSFLPLLVIPVFGSPGVFLITSLCAALFDSLFVMAQRYNRPRVVRIYEMREAKCP